MSWTTERARVAALSRSRSADDPAMLAARRNLCAARIADFIERELHKAPPLTDSQRADLARMFGGEVA